MNTVCFWLRLFGFKICIIAVNSGRNYGRSSVMTDQISNLTEQSFAEIRRNDRSLNETIWTPTCNKLHVFDMIEEMKSKKFVHWILSLHATKFYKARVNSFSMGKLLIKIKPIYKFFHCFRKQHVLSRLFIRVFFGRAEGSGGGRTNQHHVNALTHVPFIISFTNEQSISICRGRQKVLLTAHLL